MKKARKKNIGMRKLVAVRPLANKAFKKDFNKVRFELNSNPTQSRLDMCFPVVTIQVPAYLLDGNFPVFKLPHRKKKLSFG